MLIRHFKTASQLLSKPTIAPLSSQIASPFADWKPRVPKHQIRLDKSTYRLAHPIWDLKAAEQVEITHRKPEGVKDWLALNFIRALRKSFDFFSGYKPGKCDESSYLARIIFLETIAGVPGMIGAMIRHTRSVGLFRPDGGWIHHLLEEAENERMHLFTFLHLRQPGFFFKAFILVGQAVFVMAYTTFYVLAPRTAHRFVGYLEEEAVLTYTHCVEELNNGTLKDWITRKAPQSAIEYWDMHPDATVKDLILIVRADEMMHREVNHRLADLHSDEPMDHMETVVVESVKKVNEPKNEPSS